MRLLLGLLLLSFVMAAATACNTVEGFGKDVSKAGDSIRGSSEKTKEEM